MIYNALFIECANNNFRKLIVANKTLCKIFLLKIIDILVLGGRNFIVSATQWGLSCTGQYKIEDNSQ